MPYELFIGLRYLRARKKPYFLSFISLISIGGVALGVMALIIVLAVMTGFESVIREKILGTNAHLWVLKYGEGGIEQPQEVITKVREVPEVLAAAPFTFHQGMLTSAEAATGVVIRGIDLLATEQVTDLKRYLKEADPSLHREGLGPTGILLGRSLANRLGVGLGSWVQVISPFGGMITPFGLAPRMKPFQVVGIFEVGMYEYDTGLAYISLPSAQELFRMGEAVTGIEVKVAEVFRVEAVARAIQERLGFPYMTQTWIQMNRNLFLALKKEKVLMFIILAVVLVVAAFGIAGNLITTVLQKRRDIGIMKAMGATPWGIMRIFMAEGLIVGITGTLLGLLGGFAFVINLDRLSAFLERFLGFEMFPSDVYFLDRLPYRIHPSDVTATVLTALILSVLAALYPAWRAARLDPVTAIRYE